MVSEPCRRPGVPHTLHGDLDDLKLKFNLRCFFHFWYPARENFEKMKHLFWMFSHHLRLSITLPSSSEDPEGQPIILACFNTSADTSVRVIVIAQVEKFEVFPFEIKPVVQYMFLSLNKCSTILPWFILFANLWLISIKGSHTYFVPVVFSPDAHCVRYAVIDSPIP